MPIFADLRPRIAVVLLLCSCCKRNAAQMAGGVALNCFMPANAAACFHTSALHPAQYSWPGKHDKGLCLLPGSRFPGVLLPLFQAEQHLRTFFKTSLTIFPCCGIVIKSTIWARSSAGRAFGSHPRGRGFDPLRVHQFAASFCTMRRFLLRTWVKKKPPAKLVE